MSRLSTHELHALCVVKLFGFPKTVDYTLRRKLVEDGYLERTLQPPKYSLTSKGHWALKQELALRFQPSPQLSLWDHLRDTDEP